MLFRTRIALLPGCNNLIPLIAYLLKLNTRNNSRSYFWKQQVTMGHWQHRSVISSGARTLGSHLLSGGKCCGQYLLHLLPAPGSLRPCLRWGNPSRLFRSCASAIPLYWWPQAALAAIQSSWHHPNGETAQCLIAGSRWMTSTPRATGSTAWTGDCHGRPPSRGTRSSLITHVEFVFVCCINRDIYTVLLVCHSFFVLWARLLGSIWRARAKWEWC